MMVGGLRTLESYGASDPKTRRLISSPFAAAHQGPEIINDWKNKDRHPGNMHLLQQVL